MATQHAAVKRLAPPLHAFIVDGFNFIEPDCRHYLLTHAHSDHTCGLHGSFDVGTIYCSALTARVLRALPHCKRCLLAEQLIGARAPRQPCEMTHGNLMWCLDSQDTTVALSRATDLVRAVVRERRGGGPERRRLSSV